jgi:hypothetical protein
MHQLANASPTELLWVGEDVFSEFCKALLFGQKYGLAITYSSEQSL